MWLQLLPSIQFRLLKVSITSRCSGMEHGEVDQTRAGELRISSLLRHQKTFFDVMQIETKYKGYESEGILSLWYNHFLRNYIYMFGIQ